MEPDISTLDDLAKIEDYDCQVTLHFEDGSQQTFTILRDRNMRWNGVGADSPLVKIETEWFYNPTVITEPEGVTNEDG